MFDDIQSDILCYGAFEGDHALVGYLMDAYNDSVDPTDDLEELGVLLIEPAYKVAIFDAYELPPELPSELKPGFLEGLVKQFDAQGITLLLCAPSDLLAQTDLEEGTHYYSAFERPYNHAAIKEAIDDFI